MNILIYGDSNAWGYVPNAHGYSKDAVMRQYPVRQRWWYGLTEEHQVTVNALCGRAIRNENPWLPGRNAMATVEQEVSEPQELVILALGTNDCKSQYQLTAEEITGQIRVLAERLRSLTGCRELLLISPPPLCPGTPVTDTYYQGGAEKTARLDLLYRELSREQGYRFVSGAGLPVGEDGEHLTAQGHQMLGQRVQQELSREF